MEMEAGFVSVSVTDRIALVTLNRPQALNAISGEVADQLARAFSQVAQDHDAWVMILRAQGDKAFCVGADLKERASFTLDDFYRNREQVRVMFSSLRKVPQPTIASVFGFALGGGFELALSCDLIVAAHDAVFGLPETRVGLIPAGGGTQLLARKVGSARAKDLIFRGRRFQTPEATALGLISELAERSKLEAATMQLAAEICKSSPVAVRQAKASIDAALGVPIEDGMELEHEAWRQTITSHDRAEGIQAFTEKRDPQWRNA